MNKRTALKLTVLAALTLLCLAPVAATSAATAAAVHQPRMVHGHVLGKPFLHDGIRYVWRTYHQTGQPILELAAASFTSKQLCTDGSPDAQGVVDCWRDQNDANTVDNPVVLGRHVTGGGTAVNITSTAAGTFTDPFGTVYQAYTFEFTSHAVHEIGANNACLNIETRAAGAFGTVWAMTPNFTWINTSCSTSRDFAASTDLTLQDQLGITLLTSGINAAVTKFEIDS